MQTRTTMSGIRTRSSNTTDHRDDDNSHSRRLNFNTETTQGLVPPTDYEHAQDDSLSMPPPPNKSSTSNFYPAGQPTKLSPDPDFSIGQHPLKSSERSGRRGAKKSGASTLNTKSAKMRTPHAHDVLCGRGGSINSHKGNITFRNWVRERKQEYNLAANKNEKAKISKDIVDKVKSLVPPGRFLMKNESPSGDRDLWVEIDDTKAMAKTSQALREGAPTLRAQAKAKNITPTPAKSSSQSTRTKGKRKYHGGDDDGEVDVEKNEEFGSDHYNSTDESLSYDVDELTEDVIHPIITCMSDGHRGKQLIIPDSFEEYEYYQEYDHHQKGEQVQAVNYVPSTPPYKKQHIEQSTSHPSASNQYSTTRNEYPTSSKTSTPVLVDYHEKIPVPSVPSIPFGSFSLAQNYPPPPPRYNNNNNNNNRHKKNDGNNAGLNFIRAHSLALSDTFEDGFDPTARVINPFENDESTRGSSISSFSEPIPQGNGKGNGNTRHETNRNQIPHQESTTSLDKMMKSKGFNMIGSTSFNSNHRNNVNTYDERRRDASYKPSSNGRSYLSDLSDINYLEAMNNNTVEFDEGMKDVYDAVYPGLYTPRGTDTAPTHLIPYSTFPTTSIPSDSSSSSSSRVNNNRWSAFRRLPREKPYSRSGSYSSKAVNSSHYYQ